MLELDDKRFRLRNTAHVRSTANGIDNFASRLILVTEIYSDLCARATLENSEPESMLSYDSILLFFPSDSDGFNVDRTVVLWRIRFTHV